MNRDNAQNVLGVNNNNNQFLSDEVVANADGSILERLQYIQDTTDAIATGEVLVKGVADAGTSSTTEIPIAGLAGYGNDFFNTRFFMQVLKNANNLTAAPEGEVRQITDYVSATGTFTVTAFSAAVEENDVCLILHESQVMIGRDDANNTAATTSVAANADGSILERLEDLKDRVNTVDDYVDGANLEKLTSAADGGGNAYPDTVAQESVIAYILSKAANPVTTSYDNTTDSLEAISDKVDAVDDYIDGANLEKLTAAADGGGNAYPDSVVQESVIAYLMSKAANPVTTSYDNTTDSLEAISDKLTAIDDYVDSEVAAIATDIGDPSARANFGSIETMIGVPDAANSCLDDMLRTGFDSSAIAANADGSIMERAEAIKDQVTNLAAGGGIGAGIVRKTVTFSNTNADVNLFTVTGAVIARLVCVCTTNLESAGGCNIGVDAGSTAVIADTASTDIEAGDIWHDATPDSSVELTSVMKEYIIANGTTIVLDVEAAKQVDSGVLEFYLFWTALSSNGAVAPAA